MDEGEFADSDGDGVPDYLDPDTLEELVIYNEFSPNGDGVNDFFVIEGLESYPDNRVEVFNRWGNSVFKKVNYDNSWDGNSDGTATVNAARKLPIGSYFYVLELGYGIAAKTGWIYINR